MAVATTEYKHIQLNEQGTAMIAGSTMKVVELVMAYLADGLSPAELHTQYPYLSLGQIHSALAYYWDHQERLDAEMQRREAYVREIQRQTPESPFVARLKAQGLLP